METRPLKIIVSGMIAADPFQGGATWAVLQYVIGLRQLGHDVLLIEPINQIAIRPTVPSGTSALSASLNASYFRSVMTRFGLQESAALLRHDSTESVGLPFTALRDFASGADLLLNISGMLQCASITDAIPVRAYLDLDPAFIQMWNAVQGIDMRFDGHTHFVTVGQRIGRPDCMVPTCGRTWIITLQPVVLDAWPAKGPGGPVQWDGLTTIANWRGYGSIEFAGKLFGQKAHSVRELIDLPRRSAVPCMPALAIHAAETRDLAALAANGWNLLDPSAVAATPDLYQAFVQRSWGELGIAKSGYVESRCGWFSDRSACYLASGRPVIAQETGFAESLPTGEGLLRFSTTDEAVAAIDVVRSDYPRHCRTARRIAEEHFESNRVLTRLLCELGVSA